MKNRSAEFAAITRVALARGFDELALDDVTIALPFTRNAGAALRLLGFRADGEVTYGTVRFRRFRLSGPDARRASEPDRDPRLR